MNQRKVLHMQTPMITSYPRHANLLSILENEEMYIEWLIENYIELQSAKMKKLKLEFHIGYDVIHFFQFCPFVVYNRAERNIVNKAYHDIIEYLCDLILDNRYVYVLVDRFYVSCYPQSYQKEHHYHDIFLYGFDQEEKIFYAADFFDGKYSLKKTTFSEIKQGYESVKDNEDWLHGVISLQVIKTMVYNLDVNKVIRNLREYIERFNPSVHNEILFSYMKSDYFDFGINIYQTLLRYFDAENVNFKVDLRPFHLLCDHKRILVEMVRHLIRNHYLLEKSVDFDQVTQLESNAMVIRNVLIKYNITGNKKELIRCKNLLQQLMKDEKALISILLEKINPYKSLDVSNQGSIGTRIEYIGADTKTKGDYYTSYGTIGYVMCCNDSLLPKDVQLLIRNAFKFCNAVDIEDERAYQIKNKTKRISASYVSHPGKSIEIEMKTRREYKITIHILDWWSNDSSFQLEVIDMANQSCINQVVIEKTYEGVYYSFCIKGHVKFVLFPYNETDCAFFSGIFVDQMDV